MALDTYTNLKAAIADFANRSDLTTQIVDFVTLTEARLNDMLLLKNMDQEDPLTCVIGQNYVALPAGYISPIALWIVASSGTNVRTMLDPAAPEELPYSPSNSIPRYYAIDGANIRFDCPAAAAYTLYFRYIKSSNLSGSTATNYLLARRPDIYLSGALSELARYTKDVDLFNVWESKFVKACSELKATENRARGAVPLRTDFSTRVRSNIFNGE
jgi:hypothetical protein